MNTVLVISDLVAYPWNSQPPLTPLVTHMLEGRADRYCQSEQEAVHAMIAEKEDQNGVGALMENQHSVTLFYFIINKGWIPQKAIGLEERPDRWHIKSIRRLQIFFEDLDRSLPSLHS